MPMSVGLIIGLLFAAGLAEGAWVAVVVALGIYALVLREQWLVRKWKRQGGPTRKATPR